MKRRLGLLLAVGALAVLAALVWVSRAMLRLEHAETAAKDEAKYQYDLRLALSRLDRAGARLLEREAARPSQVYSAFYYLPDETWRAKDLKKLRPEQVYTQSPLLGEKPDFVRLHFQVEGDGRLSSPQVPTGTFLELCDLPPAALEANRATLARIADLVDASDLVGKVQQAERQTANWRELVDDTPQGEQRREEVQKRAQVVATAKRGGRQDPRAGTLEPVWQEGELLFLRRVRAGDELVLQGFLVDWERLRALLLEEIEDLFPAATLRPAADGNAADRRLLSLPVVVDAPRRVRDPSRWTATHTVLLISWAVVLLAGTGAGYALKKSVEFGERQRSFASMMTHELRSPLTTFGLYAELLAEGLVKDPDKREEYHRTLVKESDHMARMVENVITHARLEEGRARLSRERILLPRLLEQVAPDLHACAEKAGVALALDPGGAPDAALETDPAAIGQILLNLVENACKYGHSGERPAVVVGAAVDGGVARLFVRDRGPGVPDGVARRIFRPFERGGRDEADPVRGLGLGLALGRGLARDLGGDLTLERPPDGGARFVLTLPLA